MPASPSYTEAGDVPASNAVAGDVGGGSRGDLADAEEDRGPPQQILLGPPSVAGTTSFSNDAGGSFAGTSFSSDAGRSVGGQGRGPGAKKAVAQVGKAGAQVGQFMQGRLQGVQGRLHRRGMQESSAQVRCRWMWMDSTRENAKANPLRWSVWKGVDETVGDIEKRRGGKSRPLCVAFEGLPGSGGMETMLDYDGIEAAVEGIRTMRSEIRALEAAMAEAATFEAGEAPQAPEAAEGQVAGPDGDFPRDDGTTSAAVAATPATAEASEQSQLPPRLSADVENSEAKDAAAFAGAQTLAAAPAAAEQTEAAGDARGLVPAPIAAEMLIGGAAALAASPEVPPTTSVAVAAQVVYVSPPSQSEALTLQAASASLVSQQPTSVAPQAIAVSPPSQGTAPTLGQSASASLISQQPAPDSPKVVAVSRASQGSTPILGQLASASLVSQPPSTDAPKVVAVSPPSQGSAPTLGQSASASLISQQPVPVAPKVVAVSPASQGGAPTLGQPASPPLVSQQPANVARVASAPQPRDPSPMPTGDPTLGQPASPPLGPAGAGQKKGFQALGARLKGVQAAVGGAVKVKAEQLKEKRQAVVESGVKLGGFNLNLKRRRELSKRSSNIGQVGTVTVNVLGGKFSVQRPYFIIEMNGNETRTETNQYSKLEGEASSFVGNDSFASSDGHNAARWGVAREPITLPVFDPSSDLRLFLYDDGVMAEKCCGRVIIPLSELCTNSWLPKPKPLHEATFKVIPAFRQGQRQVQTRYEEAIVGLQGSGIAKPKDDLGAVELQLQLELSAPHSERLGLLAAYAEAAPEGRMDDADDEDGDGEEGQPAEAGDRSRWINAKDVRGSTMRLRRVFTASHLLEGPWCFLLLLVLFWACFWASAWQLPWMLFGLTLLNGLLAYRQRGKRHQEMIFWEDGIGELPPRPSQMEKYRRLRKVVFEWWEWIDQQVSKLERGQSLFNFADSPITVVTLTLYGIACGLLSVTLYMLGARNVLFGLGFAALVPSMRKAMPARVKDFAARFTQRDASPGAGSSKPPRRFAALTRRTLNVLQRAPDGKDVVHRYFCQEVQQQVQQQVPLLQDAEQTAALANCSLDSRKLAKAGEAQEQPPGEAQQSQRPPPVRYVNTENV